MFRRNRGLRAVHGLFDAPFISHRYPIISHVYLLQIPFIYCYIPFISHLNPIYVPLINGTWGQFVQQVVAPGDWVDLVLASMREGARSVSGCTWYRGFHPMDRHERWDFQWFTPWLIEETIMETMAHAWCMMYDDLPIIEQLWFFHSCIKLPEV